MQVFSGLGRDKQSLNPFQLVYVERAVLADLSITLRADRSECNGYRPASTTHFTSTERI